MNESRRLGLTAKELADELQFCYESERSRILQIVVPAILILCALAMAGLLFAFHATVFGVSSAMFLAAAVWTGIDAARNRNRIYSTTLSVSSQRFEATGDNLKAGWLGTFTRPGKIAVPSSEVTSFGYSPGGEDTESGLWVSSSLWRSHCLLPGLSREQATSVAAAIARRFPEIGSKLKPETH